MQTHRTRFLIFIFVTWISCFSEAGEPQWVHLSTQTGDLPLPGPSIEETGALIADLDKDGTNDFVQR